MINYIAHWLQEVFTDANNRRKQFLARTSREKLVTIYQAVILVALISVVLLSCKGQEFKVMDGGKLVQLHCNVHGRHFMNSNVLKRYEAQGIDACSCIGVKANRPGCRFRGPQVVPAPEPPKAERKTR